MTNYKCKPDVEAPVAVVMISLNEGHNMKEVLDNLSGWAQEIFLVDSLSTDSTIDIALEYGVHVIQREFLGFGDQWNFALDNLPITAKWTMKLDPDERITDDLKKSIIKIIDQGDSDGIVVERRLWFMGKVLTVTQNILIVWKTGSCRFTDVAVNEHPLVVGDIEYSSGYLEHHDSPDLDHWFIKQNRYTTAEATSQFKGLQLGVKPRLLGSSLERRMWIKRNFWRIPGRYILLFLYHWIILGVWRSGKVGWVWAHLRTEVYRMWGYKYFEMSHQGRTYNEIPSVKGDPDSRVSFYE